METEPLQPTKKTRNHETKAERTLLTVDGAVGERGHTKAAQFVTAKKREIAPHPPAMSVKSHLVTPIHKRCRVNDAYSLIVLSKRGKVSNSQNEGLQSMVQREREEDERLATQHDRPLLGATLTLES